MTFVSTVPLWALCTLNDDTLPETTSETFSFEYVDISNVTAGHISDVVKTHSFGEAPSRARRLAVAGDVIVSTVRTYLKAIAQVTPAEATRVYSTGFAVLRPREGVADSRYLAYMLTSGQVMDEIVATSVGVSYPAIQGTALHRIRVPYRSFASQRAVADHLDRETHAIDAMLAKLDELSERLEARRRTTIETLLAKHPRSRLRWAIALSQTGPFGTQVSASEYVTGGVPLINPTHISRKGITPDEVVTVTRAKAEELSRHLLRPGDIVLGRKGDVDKAALVSGDLGPALCGSDSMLIRAESTVCSAELLWWFFQSTGCHQQLERTSVGAAVTGLNQTAIAHLWMPLPNRDDQQAVVAELDKRTDEIDTMLVKVMALKRLLIEHRAALITDVVAGRKDVA